MHVSDLYQTIRSFPLHIYQALYVGLSGGIDSCVLLHILSLQPNLKSRLKAIHINHNIQPTESKIWQTHCEKFCHTLNIPLITQTISEDTFQNKSNLEEQARNARYQAFESIIPPGNALLLAHHQNDQAETLLLRLCRGAGIKGLSAMQTHSQRDQLTVLRPFLDNYKKDIENYAVENKLNWISDPSNQDSRFDRNFIRNEVLPLLNKRYPNVNNNLARTAKLCLETQQHLSQLMAPYYKDCICANNTLSVTRLLTYPSSDQALIVRQWLSNFKAKMPTQATLHSFLQALSSHEIDKHPLLDLNTHCAQTHKKRLYYYKKLPSIHNQKPTIWPPPFTPQKIDALEADLTLEEKHQDNNISIPSGAKLAISVRLAGETIVFNGQTKKVKKLLQQLDVPCWQRPFIPLLYINDKLAAISDKIIADPFKKPLLNTHQLCMKKHIE